MLTVVIPVYNVEKYLKKCIDSVLEQSYKDMEVFLINDGSTDSSGDICKRYESIDRRIRYIEKENGGSGTARNLGLRMAQGEYITFLDSDDWWGKDYARIMMEYAEKADIVICDLYYVDDIDGQREMHVSKIRMPDRIVQNTEDDIDFINKGRTFLCGKIFRREIFKKWGIWQPTMAINDIPIVPTLIALSEKICRVGEPLYYYLRTREGNTISSVLALKSFGTALINMKENFERFDLVMQYEKALRKMYYSQIRFALRKAKIAYKAGKMNLKSYEEVRNYLFDVIENFWEEWPNVDGKYFFYSDDSDINQAIKNVIFDDDMLSKEEPFTYRVREESIKLRQMKTEEEMTSHDIKIIKDFTLEDEDLWWQMADDLLFQLARVNFLRKESLGEDRADECTSVSLDSDL